MADAAWTRRGGYRGIGALVAVALERRGGTAGGDEAGGAQVLADGRQGQPISSVRDRKVICNRVLGVLLQ